MSHDAVSPAFSSPGRDAQARVPNVARLRRFVGRFAELVESTDDERQILESGGALLAQLVSEDDWLPDEYAQPDPVRYQQYLLHCDGRERFSIVSFVWGPGQATPVHDHQVWGLVGMLRGAEQNQAYTRDSAGALVPQGPPEQLVPGVVSQLSPRLGDIHQVSNAHADRTSISVHVYGGNIGAVERATYDADGRPKRFVSGYANRFTPNLWDRSK